MTIGEAIQHIKAGGRATRAGWNGKNQYIELVSNVSYVRANGETVNPLHDAFGNHAIAFVGTSGIQVGWLASQSDLLATDWKAVE